MKKIPDTFADSTDLRQRAIAQLKMKTGHKDIIPSAEAARKLLLELQVQQIELEMQNEELRQLRAELEASLDRFAQFFDFAPTSYLTLQRNGTIHEINLTGARLIGIERSRLIGRRLEVFVAAESRPGYDTFLQEVFAGRASAVCEVVLITADKRHLVEHLEAVADTSGNICHMTLVDITARKQAENALLESEELFRTITENVGDLIAMLDQEGRRLYNNPSYRKIFGDDELKPGSDSFSEIHPEDRARIKKIFRKTVATGIGERSEFRFQLKDGSIRHIESEGNVVHDATCKVSKVIVVSRDVTGRKQIEKALLESERRFRALFENAAIGIAQVSTAGQFMQINDLFCKIIGYSQHEVLSQKLTFQQLTFPDDLETGLAWVKNLLDGDSDSYTIEKRCIRKDGSIVWVNLSASLLRDAAEKPLYFIVAVDNISERKNLEEQLRRLSYFDNLTGLPNRVLLSDRTQQALAFAKRDKARMALMFVDLDEFKPVNDTLGHNIGDLLLKEVAIRMQDCVRASDTVARIGGDEFVVLLATIENDQDAMVVAEKIRHSLCQPFVVAGHGIHISSSIGIAVYPENGSEEKILLKNADSAMYYAKESGRNTVRLYSSSDA